MEFETRIILNYSYSEKDVHGNNDAAYICLHIRVIAFFANEENPSDPLRINK